MGLRGSTVSQPNLFTASPRDIRELLNEVDDPEMIRILLDLEEAALAGDEVARVDVVDRLFDLLVLRRGVGL